MLLWRWVQWKLETQGRPVGLLSFRATSRHLNLSFHSMWTNSLRTVIHQEDQGESSSQNKTLEWNQNSLFFRALDKLGKDGKSFKMEMATPISAPDCHMDYNPATLSNENKSSSTKYAGQMCQITYIQWNPKDTRSRNNCLLPRRLFGVWTTIGQTLVITLGKHNRISKSNIAARTQIPSFKSIIKYRIFCWCTAIQALDFASWLVHGLRGASDYYGFNQLPHMCNDERGRGLHYCRKWKLFASANFNVYKLQEFYKKSTYLSDESKGSAQLSTSDGSIV